MSKPHGVSGNTHSQQQCNHYANQHNPNNPAFVANKRNEEKTASRKRKESRYDIGILDGESYGWCDD